MVDHLVCVSQISVEMQCILHHTNLCIYPQDAILVHKLHVLGCEICTVKIPRHDLCTDSTLPTWMASSLLDDPVLRSHIKAKMTPAVFHSRIVCAEHK